MKQSLTEFITELTELFTKRLLTLIYQKSPHALYIDDPNIGSTLIQDSKYFRQQVRELILDHLSEPTAHTVISINLHAAKLVFYTQEQWEHHPFFNCSGIAYLNYKVEKHLVTLAIR